MDYDVENFSQLETSLEKIFRRDDLPAEFKEYLSEYSDLSFLSVKFENELESPQQQNSRNNDHYLSEIKRSNQKFAITIRSFLWLPFYHIEMCVNTIDHIYGFLEVSF